jgi:prepilin-type N-terminal cleavage/methylation domain-containing protein
MTARVSLARQSGFTLIELVLAIGIFVLIITTIYGSLRAATQALVVGRASMEIYQTSRAGLNRMMVDLRKALAPASFPFNDKKEDPNMPEDEYYLKEEEEEQLHVTFRGDTKQVQFVIRQEMETDDGPEMDIREVRFHLDAKERLVKEVYRSLLEARLAELTARRMEERSPAPDRAQGRQEKGRRFVPDAKQGYFDKPIVQVVCEEVKEVKFAYFDGANWKTPGIPRRSWSMNSLVTWKTLNYLTRTRRKLGYRNWCVVM